VNVLAFRRRESAGTVVAWLRLITLFIISLSATNHPLTTWVKRPRTFCFLLLHSVHEVVVLSARGWREDEELDCIVSDVGRFGARRSEVVYRQPHLEDDVSFRRWAALILAPKGRRGVQQGRGKAGVQCAEDNGRNGLEPERHHQPHSDEALMQRSATRAERASLTGLILECHTGCTGHGKQRVGCPSKGTLSSNNNACPAIDR
jgi:hypothetical protein